jgi:hypothetical protein
MAVLTGNDEKPVESKELPNNYLKVVKALAPYQVFTQKIKLLFHLNRTAVR